MKNNILFTLTIAALFITFAADAGLYKGLDEEGNVVYSDKPFADSEKFTPPPITVIQAPKIPPKEESTEEQPVTETTYKKLSIAAPTDDQTIWNEPQLIVSLRLAPALDIAAGHTTWLLMDGKPLVKNSQSLTLQIGRSDRGSHTLTAQVRNKKGKILKSSRSITVHIKNTVITRPQHFAR